MGYRSFILAAAVLAVCGPALGETIPVSPGGITIQEAIDAASAGDTVLVSRGVYPEHIDFRGKAITVRSSDGPQATVISPGISYEGQPPDELLAIVRFDDGETGDAVLEGFMLHGGWIGVLCIESAPTIRRNILVGQNVTNWAAICLAGPGYPDSATTGSAPAVIVNNTIVFCRNGGISTFSTQPPVIRNNIIAFNRHYGIHREGIQPGVAHPDLGYNDVYGSPVLYYEIEDPGTGSISLNPMIDRSYGLLRGSPCIDAGDPDPAFNDPDGSRNDIGAVPGESPCANPVPTNEWISVYCASVVCAGDPLPPGTVIEAYDPGGVLCGRDRVRNDGTYGFMPIYRDDIYTDFDEGAEPGDPISFTVSGAPVETDPPIYWTANGDVFELCDFSDERCIDIELRTGWNLISWNLAVYGDIEDILGDIEDCVDVVLGYELGGAAWDPALLRFSTMRELDYSHGYWLRMNCDATLRICGPEIPKTAEGSIPPRPNGIFLYEGWNLIGYWPRETLAVEEGFRNISGILSGASGFDRGALVWMP
ncbi:MAG: right-handed parallel beta-helix repeat-containing protein, partial [Candidatus Krumholzibacteria bacterium]|nr:right-handed parallel beta-helix repeat-containing protein [Candidatus Krumholzibacteria bacterium]